MDALSEVLRLARFGAQVTLDATARAPWCVSVPASATIARAHLVVEGACLLQAGRDAPMTLAAGEIAYLPAGDAHLIGSALEGDALALSTLVRTPLAGELAPIALGGTGGRATRWISIATSFERHLGDTLFACLPAVVKLDLLGAPAYNGLLASLGLHLSASDAPAVGDGAKHARLAELAMIETLRRHVLALPRGGTGWLAALNDRYVGRALALVHGRPAEPWTVERLGRQVGSSWSALAERFSAVMGEPIIAFLTRWRLRVAAETLLTTPRPIEAIAREAGYESAGAFSHAFKRVFGKPPSVWRKKARRRGA